MVSIAVNSLSTAALGGLSRTLVLDIAELSLYDAAGKAGDTPLQTLLQNQHGFGLFVDMRRRITHDGIYVNGLLSVQAHAETDAAKIAAGQMTAAQAIADVVSTTNAAHLPQEAGLLVSAADARQSRRSLTRCPRGSATFRRSTTWCSRVRGHHKPRRWPPTAAGVHQRSYGAGRRDFGAQC